MSSSDRRRNLGILVLAMAVLIAAPLAVVATDAFTDVPESNVHHDDITWLKDAGVTIGCNPPANDEYCPGDNVTRQQMASFMRRLAENRVVDAATAGVAYEAIREKTVQVTESFEEDALSITTLDLPPGSYILTATLGASALPGGPGVLQSVVSCQLTAADVTSKRNVQVGTNAGNSMFQDITIQATAVLDTDTSANVSCWRPSGLGNERPVITAGARLIAYNVGEVVSEVVTE